MTEQKKIVPKSDKIPVKGATFIYHPAGSQYKDPDTKTMVTREEPHLQYAKAGMPAKWEMGRADLENLVDFLNSTKGKEYIATLPEVSTLEPNSV